MSEVLSRSLGQAPSWICPLQAPEARGNAVADIRLRTALFATLTLACAVSAGDSSSKPGVFADRIVFGQSAAFKGPAAALGTDMREGLIAAFEEANLAGGVHGRRLELISYNDGYEPEQSIANTRRLIEEDRVFALVGQVGTPTSRATQPIATDLDVPFLGPLTGAAADSRGATEPEVAARLGSDDGRPAEPGRSIVARCPRAGGQAGRIRRSIERGSGAEPADKTGVCHARRAAGAPHPVPEAGISRGTVAPAGPARQALRLKAFRPCARYARPACARRHPRS